MRKLAVASAALVFLPAVCFAAGAGGVRRLAVVVGANHGAADRIPLRYAVTDAERMAAVVTQMGGVEAAECIVLREPTRRALLDSLATARLRAAAVMPEASRVEVLVYFSGHADEQGLMLGRELMPYRELRTAIDGVGADVGITILDACASGAITRLKGGKPHRAFLTGAPGDVQGYAFLTSSSANEAAQESERLQASFFTHALLTGMRGAADLSGDGRVTLGEAYQFAFGETLASTAKTQAGAQHPAYDIKMAGTGDVVLTDVRHTASSLILAADYDGRFLVLNANRQLVAELYKPFGRTVELGLEPGDYDVYFEQGRTLLASSLKLVDGQRHELAREGMRETQRVPTRRRGGEAEETAGNDLLNRRTRVQVSTGVWGAGNRDSSITLVHGLTPRLGLDLSWVHFDGTSNGVLLGARYYPLPSGKMKPYLVGRAGLLDLGGEGSWSRRFGATLGLGADLFVGRKFSTSVEARFTQVDALQRNRSFDVHLGFGWTFGERRPDRGAEK
jgi:hypothetical protein